MAETLVSYALITLAEVKDALGITIGDFDDILTRYINFATDLIEKYCNGRRFAAADYTDEEYDGTGIYYLILKHWPLNSITILEKRTSSDYSASDFDKIDTSHYIIDSGSQINRGQVYNKLGFTKGIRNYRISYNAGYTIIPNDLEEACCKLVSYFYKTANKQEGIKSERLGRYSVTYDKSKLTKIMEEADVKDILDFYRVPQI